MAWLLEIKDKDGNALYTMLREKAKNFNDPECKDFVRLDYINKFGYYVTESSEHNAEYNKLYIKHRYTELIEKFNISLDEYPCRCIGHTEKWTNQKKVLFNGGTHKRSC